VSDENVQVVGVIGCGRMGRRMAQAAALAGFEVRLLDAALERTKQAKGAIIATLAEEAAAGRLPRQASEASAARLRVVSDVPDLAEADCVLEAIPEDIAAKKKLFAKLDAALPPTVLLASGTSSLSIAELAEGMRSAGRMVGMHFFDAGADIPAVEVVVGPATGDQAFVEARAVAAKLGRTPLRVVDSPGFIGNRVNMAFCFEAIRLVELGLGDVASIDRAARAVGDHASGPFERMDRQGLGTVLALAETVRQGLGEATRVAPPPALRKLVAAGHLGRECGRGFYDYSGRQPTPAYEAPPKSDPSWQPSPTLREMAAFFGKPADRAMWLFGRLLLAAINESALVADSIALPRDVNLAMELAFAFPEGPLAVADRVGLDLVESLMREFHEDLDGDHSFRPSPLLERLVAAGRLGEKTACGFLHHAL